MDDTPRMTAAETDARFAALVSEYRDSKRSPRTRQATDSTNGTLVVLIVFGLGVACGVIASTRPLTALLVGIPLILVVRMLARRRRRDDRDD